MWKVSTRAPSNPQEWNCGAAEGPLRFGGHAAKVRPIPVLLFSQLWALVRVGLHLHPSIISSCPLGCCPCPGLCAAFVLPELGLCWWPGAPTFWGADQAGRGASSVFPAHSNSCPNPLPCGLRRPEFRQGQGEPCGLSSRTASKA